MNSNNILFIPGYNMDSNCYLIGDMLVDTGTGTNEDYTRRYFISSQYSLSF